MSNIPSTGQAAFDYQFSIMQAIKDGVAVQVRSKDASVWRAHRPVTDAFVALNFSDFEFRIKPQPLEVYMNVYQDGSLGTGHVSATAAEQARGERNARIIKLREVED